MPIPEITSGIAAYLLFLPCEISIYLTSNVVVSLSKIKFFNKSQRQGLSSMLISRKNRSAPFENIVSLMSQKNLI